MQMKSHDPSQLKKNLLTKMDALILNCFTSCIILRPLGIYHFCAWQSYSADIVKERKGLIKGITCNEGLATTNKASCLQN